MPLRASGGTSGEEAALDHYFARDYHGAWCENALVDWGPLTEELIGLALERIPSEHLVPLFDRISRDVAANGSGFSDFALFPHEVGQVDDHHPGPFDLRRRLQQSRENPA
jgi:hypothetical protein